MKEKSKFILIRGAGAETALTNTTGVIVERNTRANLQESKPTIL